MRKKSLIIALFILIVDQVIKITIDELFAIGESKCVISKFFYVTKVFNKGAAWGFFEGARIILIMIAIVALVLLFNYENNFANKYRNVVAFGLVYGGLFGNLSDRIMYGYVIDYFHFFLGSYSFPVFNVADIAIVCGFILIIYGVLKGEDRNGNSSRRK